MSETVNYTPRVRVGTAAVASIVEIAGLFSSIAGKPEERLAKWQSARERIEVRSKAVEEKMRALESHHRTLLPGLEDSGHQILSACAVAESLDSVENLAVMARMEHGAEIEQIARQKENWLRHLRNGGMVDQELLCEARSVEERVKRIAEDAHVKLLDAETKVIRKLTGESLSQLGYTLAPRGEALRATKGPATIWLAMNEFAELSLDVGGFSGLACQDEIGRLERELARNGIELQRVGGNPHGRREGGVLAQRLQNMFPPSKVSPGEKKNKAAARPPARQPGKILARS